jgi:predicted ATPase
LVENLTMASMLSEIRVAGFKSLRDVRFDLRPLNVLIGANGAGKSNLLSLFKLISEIAGGRFQNYVAASGGADRLLYFRKKITRELRIRLKYDNPSLTYECTLAPTQEDTLFFADERYGSGSAPTILHGGHVETRLSQALPPRADGGIDFAVQRKRTLFLQTLSAIVYHLHDTSPSAPLRATARTDDNRLLRSDGSNLAPFLFWLKEKHDLEYKRIRDSVRLVAPFFEDFSLSPSNLPKYIKLEWAEVGDDGYRDASDLSDGTLRFMCLATLLLQPQPPGLILIDEPELGLHPYAIGMLAELVQAASRRSRIVVSTQSAALINHFSPEDVIVVERTRENGQPSDASARQETVFKRLETAALEKWLDDYEIGDLWEKNLLGGRPTYA